MAAKSVAASGEGGASWAMYVVGAIALGGALWFQFLR